jgi:subfamily B ATP-binding cassette protein MsbA
MSTIKIDPQSKKSDQEYIISSYKIYKRVFREYIKPEKKTVIIVIICLFIIACTTAANAWLMQPVLDDVFMEQNSSMLYLVPIAVLINTVIKGVAEFFQNSSMKILGQTIISKIQKKLYIHIIYSDLRLFHDNPSGKLMSKFMNEINMMKRAITEGCTTAIRDLTTLIALIGLMFYQSFAMSLIFLIVFPIMFLPVIKAGKRMRNVANKIQDELGSFSTRLDETFRNIGVIKSYCKEKYELKKSEQVLDDIMASYRKAAYIESLASPIMEIASGITISLAIWYGGILVLKHDLTPGEFFSSITALLLCYKPLKAVSQINTIFQEGLSAASRLFELLDQEPLIKNISFAYKGTKKGVLDNFSIKIGTGQTVALVGSSGVGKSTVLQLLQRFYDPSKGMILIDGHRISDMKLSQLRRSIAFVSQDIALFDDSIDYNIRYGRVNATDEEVIDAAKAAAAHEFIMKLQDGYQTHIGQLGLRLSGGQKQRIAIARAILKNAPILLLDEATSALDAISETKVQQALDNLKQGRTTIIIAHRLSTIESADLIYVMSDGKAIESGTHKELLNTSIRYNKLYSHYKNSIKTKK